MENEVEKIFFSVKTACENAMAKTKVIDVNSITLSVLITEIAEAKNEIKELKKLIEDLA